METLINLRIQRDSIENETKKESSSTDSFDDTPELPLFPMITEEEAKLAMDLFHEGHHYLMERYMKRTGRFGVSCTIAQRTTWTYKQTYLKSENFIINMIMDYKKAKEMDDYAENRIILK